MPKLHILSGTLGGKSFELAEARISVGRALDNMIRLADGTVSHHHIVFVLDDDNYKIRDLNSTNGTRINGLRIVETLLHDGDQVRIGSVEMRYESANRKASEPLPPMTAGVDMSQLGAGSQPPPSFAGAGGRRHKAFGDSGVLKWILLGLGITAFVMLAYFFYKFKQVR